MLWLTGVFMLRLAAQPDAVNVELQYQDLSTRARELCSFNRVKDKLECRDLEIRLCCICD